jgi:hypothetical protein
MYKAGKFGTEHWQLKQPRTLIAQYVNKKIAPTGSDCHSPHCVSLPKCQHDIS